MKRYTLTAVVSLLALTFPFHTFVGVRPIRVNTSIGDFIIAIVIIFILFGIISIKYAPRYSIFISLFLSTIVVGLLIHLTIATPEYFSIQIAMLNLMKLIGAVAWFVGLYVLFSYNPQYFLSIFSFISVIMAILFSLLSIYNVFLLDLSRSVGPFENPNIYANYLFFNMFLLLALAKQRNQVPIGIIMSTILLIGVLTTASRGGIFGMAGGLGFLFMYYFTTKFNLTNLKFLPIFLFFIPVYLIWQNTRSYEIIMNTLANPGGEASNRIERWRYAMEGLVENPLLGLGYGQFAQATPAATDPHFTLLSIGAEAGIFALIIFALLVFYVFTDGMRMVYNTSDNYLIFIVGFIIASMVQGIVHNIYTFRTFWIAIGIIAAFYHHHQGLKNVTE